MHLKVIQSESCSMHQIRLPERLRKKFNLDYGDWLVFNTTEGNYSVQVYKSKLEDLIEYGDRHAFVSGDSPILTSKSSDVFIEPHELTIGCDPELFLLNKKTKRLALAHRILNREGQLGSDGDLAELRPDYALSPEQLMLNIKELISKIPYKVPLSLYPFASSWHAFRCCGFHIHLGLPIELLSFAANKTDAFLKNVVAALDYFVGIPAAYLDPDNKRRFNKEYGKPGDYRLSMRTFEYRTPGGFHLKSPLYTRSLLFSSFNIMEKIIHDAEKMSSGWEDTNKITNFNYFMDKYNLPSKKVIKSVFLTKDKELLKDTSRKIHTQLNSLLGEDSKFMVKERYDEQPLLYEWLVLGDET